MKQILLFTLLGSALWASNVSAGEIKVNWFEPEEYTDVKGADESDKRFQKRTFHQFEKFFTKLSKKLPEDVQLSLKVTNVNLAGDVRYNFNASREIRLITDIYWPAIEFEYQLTSKNKVIDKGEVKLKDMAFMSRGSVNRRSEVLKYEKRLLNDWFDDHVQTQLANWQKQQSAVMSE